MAFDAAELIREYLDASRHLSIAEVARIAGVRPAVVESWQSSPRKQMRQATRERLMAFLSQGPLVQVGAGGEEDWIG